LLLFLYGCSCEGDKEVSVPLDMVNASNVGSLQIEMAYDASVLQATGVEAEELGKDAMVEFNTDTPGVIVIGIVDSQGISGSGPVVSISFDVLQKDSASPLTVSHAAAHDVDTLVDLPLSLTEGSFSAGEVSEPSLNFK
jgi:hypothetical protein